MAWSSDADLDAIRPGISSSFLPSTETDWNFQRKRAEGILVTTISRVWYLDAARSQGLDPRTYPLDSTRLDKAQLKRLSALKTLACIYEYLTKGNSDDAFLNLAKRYEAEAEKEIAALRSEGFNYDWDSSGAVTTDEKNVRQPLRLVRQ